MFFIIRLGGKGRRDEMAFGDPIRGRMHHGLIYLGLPIVHPLLDDPALLSFLGFEEGSGDKASDDYTWTMGDPTKVSWVTGKVGKALLFSGLAGSYLSTPYSSVFDLQLFSISVWIKITAGGYIYGRDRYVAGKDYGVSFGQVMATGHPYIYLYKGDGSPGTYIYVQPAVDLRDDNWHHLVATYNGITVELFVDTVSKGSQTWSAAIGYYPNTPVVIGATSTYVTRIKGIIDEFYLFKRVLTASEIASLYGV